MRKFGFLKHKNQCYISIMASLAFLWIYSLRRFLSNENLLMFLYILFVSWLLIYFICIFLLTYTTFSSSQEMCSVTYISLAFNLTIVLLSFFFFFWTLHPFTYRQTPLPQNVWWDTQDIYLNRLMLYNQ